MAAQPETTISGAYVGIQALLLCRWTENVSYSLMCRQAAEDGRFCTQLIAVCKSTTIYLWRGTKKRRETKAKEKALRVCKELKACSANTSTSPQQPQGCCWCSYPCDHGHYGPVCCLPCQVSKVAWFQRRPSPSRRQSRGAAAVAKSHFPAAPATTLACTGTTAEPGELGTGPGSAVFLDEGG